jgi:hypothetical protein
MTDDTQKTNPGDVDEAIIDVSLVKYSSFAAEVLSLPQLPLDDIRSWAERLYNYLLACAKHQQKILNLSMYSYLGITKKIAEDMEAGIPPYGREHQAFIIKAKSICAVAREQMAADGKLNPTLTQFWQRNYDGFTDSQTLVVTQNQLEEPQTAEELAEKWVKRLPAGTGKKPKGDK